MDLRHGRVLGQVAGDLQRVLAGALQAQREGAQPLQGEPDIERTGGHAEPGDTSPDTRDKRLRTGDHPAHRLALPREVLAGRVPDEIGPMGDRLHQVGRGEGVIHADEPAALMGGPAEGGQVGNAQRRVGECLEQQEAGARPAGARERRGIVEVDEARLNALPGEFAGEERVGAAVYVAVHEHVIAGCQQREQCCC